MQAKGFAPELVLADTGIDPARLADPALLVDLKQCQAVVSNMIGLTGDQGLGFEVGSCSRLTDQGVVGHAIMSSRTLRQAVNLWISYSNTLVGILSTLRLDEDPSGSWSLTISEVAPTGFLYNFSVEEVLMMIMKLGAVLVDEPMRPAALEFSYPAPAHQELYFRHFRCPIRFSSRRTRVVIQSPELDRQFRSLDEDFNEICQQHCSRIARQIDSSGPVSARLRSMLLRAPGAVPALNAAATHLGMSSRSLRRHLAEEGTSYQHLVSEFRCDLARDYLSVPNIAPKEVAYLLGFRDANAFRRAFKSWTGLTIQEFCKTGGQSASEPALAE
ncbi:MAG: AraC family transcriptional regulator [Sinimarinibacterium sp.]